MFVVCIVLLCCLAVAFFFGYDIRQAGIQLGDEFQRQRRENKKQTIWIAIIVSRILMDLLLIAIAVYLGYLVIQMKIARETNHGLPTSQALTYPSRYDHQGSR